MGVTKSGLVLGDCLKTLPPSVYTGQLTKDMKAQVFRLMKLQLLWFSRSPYSINLAATQCNMLNKPFHGGYKV
jgi:hypothetical protein